MVRASSIFLRLVLPAVLACFALPALAVPPAAPSGLVVFMTKTSPSPTFPHTYAFFWNDNSSDEAAFQIDYRIGTSGAFSSLVSGISPNTTGQLQTLTALANGTTIQFQVRAYKISPTEYSAGSNIFSVTIPVTTFNPPTGVTGSPQSENIVQVAWTDASNSENGVELWMAEQPGGTFQYLGDVFFYQAQQINVSGLLPGVGYQFKLRAYRDGTPRTYTDYSATSTAVMPNPPNAPTGLSVLSVGSTSLILSWTDNSQRETSYEILARPAGTGPFTVHQIASANATNAEVINLTPGVSLDFAVRARADYAAPPSLSANSNVVTQLMRDVINSPHYAQGLVGQPFNYALTTTTGSAPISRNISGLPPGLSFNSGTGLVTGTPDTPGVTLASMSATFADGSSHSPGLAIRVLDPPVVASAIPAQTLSTGAPATVLPLGGVFNDPEAHSAVQVTTTLGTMNFILFDSATPLTVANFLSYVNSGRYANSLFHRSVPGFVVQGGGFKPAAAPNNFTSVPKFSPVLNEPGLSSIRGTIAMAKVAGDPNSATNEFFVNLENNGAILDGQNGGFTVFGRVAGGGMSVADAIAGKPTGSYSVVIDGAGRFFTEWPLDSPDALVAMDNTKVMGITSVVPLSVFSYAITANTNPGAVTTAISGSDLTLTPVARGTSNITVQATNLDGYTVNHTFTATTKSNVATLSSLVSSTGALNPAFSSGTTSYAAIVPSATSSLTLTPTPTQAQATTKVNGVLVASGIASSAIPLSLGSNLITVLVTAEDGVATETYTLDVTRVANLSLWRQTYFPGSTATSGPGADAATPQGDGVTNLMKFATGMDPTIPGTMPGTLIQSGANLVFTYTPSAEAVTDGVIFTVEYSDAPGGGAWLTDIVNQGTIGTGGSPVTATVPKGFGGQRFVHLKVTWQ